MENLVVVRVTTSYWSDKSGLHQKKSVIPIKRKCRGYNTLMEDASDIGVEEVVTRILNLDSVDDGVYEVILFNMFRDPESGYVEGYDYKLVPYKEEQKRPDMYTGILRSSDAMVTTVNMEGTSLTVKLNEGVMNIKM